MMTFRRIRWTGHVAHVGRTRIHVGVWWETYKERHHGEDKDEDERIIL
jgi:hypothetical protein